MVVGDELEEVLEDDVRLVLVELDDPLGETVCKKRECVRIRRRCREGDEKRSPLFVNENSLEPGHLAKNRMKLVRSWWYKKEEEPATNGVGANDGVNGLQVAADVVWVATDSVVKLDSEPSN